ncbi:hypothetical protein ACFVKB_47940 [Rhodococcus sp. NPDC127530]|uniref:hypothetical protein n=1 Tax=unclassified Rhodococcus (in: high G+C Gram-positive bacteria) TaxID=192944 RepID=UPI00363F335C
MAASTDRDTRPRAVSAGPPRSVSFADESGRGVRFGAVDRGCAAVRDSSSRGCVRAAGFAVVARPEDAALSVRRLAPEDDSAVASVRLGRGVGSARREVAPVDVAAGRLRGSRPASVVAIAANLFADVRAAGLVVAVTAGLSPPVVLLLLTVPPRCDVTGVRPSVLARAPIHRKYPRVDLGNRIQRLNCTAASPSLFDHLYTGGARFHGLPQWGASLAHTLFGFSAQGGFPNPTGVCPRAEVLRNRLL